MGTRGLLRRARPLLVSAIREMDTCSPRINSKLSLLLARLCQSKGNTMTKPLSPAAQAVLDAAMNTPIVLGDYDATRGRQIAAALRAVAEELTYGIGSWAGTSPIIDEDELLRVADELEGQFND